MIEQFSPVTRRIVAIGLLVLALLVAVTIILLPSLDSMGTALDRLEEARFRHDRLKAIDDAPIPMTGMHVPERLIVIAANRAAADAALAQTVQGAASAHGVTVDRASPVASPIQVPNLALEIAMHGPEPALRATIDQLEHGPTVLRFDRWRLAASPQPGGGVMLEGRIRAVWGKPL